MSFKLETDKFKEKIALADPNQNEFHQAVNEVMEDIIPYISGKSQYIDNKILDRLTEPERIIQFRVPWFDDKGEIHINRGFRVQFNSALGPYKGGLRFHPSVNISILKFLAFEQTFKNALTGLPIGSGKGGSDFDPKGKSDNEIMRFCQSFMTELQKYIGPEMDIPAGDIGVGTKEIGFLFGQYKRISSTFSGHITGKGKAWGGSALRNEATGYGLIYFLENVLTHYKKDLKSQKVAISGSGNVALHSAQKLIELKVEVLTLSDSHGCLVFSKGLKSNDLEKIIDLKIDKRGRLSEIANELPDVKYHKSKNVWDIEIEYDIALPCATQNEIEIDQAKNMCKSGTKFLLEGANMPTNPEAIDYLQKKGVIYVPGKATNAGGVAVSTLEMNQNSSHTYWPERVDKELREIMTNIHSQCVEYGKGEDASIDYNKGANLAGFVRIANAMIAQGLV